ncbi:MAG: hypothetical protein HYS21_05605 [Deltaproteobacteria bacterium]|nr:hypothetical protein [Deltaproteobacteria bacterium]
MFYKLIVECNYGCGNSFEVTRFVEESNLSEVLDKVRFIPKVKKRNTLTSIKLLKEITKDEYLKGIKKLKRFCNGAPVKAVQWNLKNVNRTGGASR